MSEAVYLISDLGAERAQRLLSDVCYRGKMGELAARHQHTGNARLAASGEFRLITESAPK
jgi:hypothetical protein